MAENEIVQQSILEHCNATGRIDEPKTPYVNYAMSDDDDDEHEPQQHLNKEEELTRHHTQPLPSISIVDPSTVQHNALDQNAQLASPREISSKVIAPLHQMEHLHSAFSNNDDVDVLDEDAATTSAYDSRPHDHEHESEEFAQKRKQHYNEYLVLKMMREKGQLDDNDEDEDDEEE